MTHAPRHMAHRSKRVSLTTDVTVRRAVSAGMTVAIPSVGAVVAAAPSMAATDSTSASAPLTATPVAKAATTHPTVMFGSRGADVQALQKVVGVNPDGVFGPLTLAAVKAYQQSHSLVADGIVGPLTWAAVSGAASDAPTSPAVTASTQASVAQAPATTTSVTPASATPATPAATTPASPVVTPVPAKSAAPKTIWVGSTDAAVKVLQSKLGVTITGVFASDLQTSVKAYQSAHGLVADGIVGPLTWGQIGVSASDVATLAPTLNVVIPAQPAVTTPAATSAPKPAVTVPVSTPAAQPATPAVTTPAVPAATTVSKPATPATTVPVITVSTTTASTPQVASASAQQIIAFAENYLGVPYVYGGNGPSSFDCSGFTSFVFSHFGYTIPRTAAQQQAYFQPTTNPQPGDLVFYGTNPVYHVAIYLGNGMMLEANHPGGSVGIRPIYGTPSGYGRVINH